MSWIRMVVSGKQEKQGPKSLLYIGNLQTTPFFNNPITCSRRKRVREKLNKFHQAWSKSDLQLDRHLQF